MGRDCYQIKVHEYHNPHLIWGELVSEREENEFEQIGVYGILPMDLVVDTVDGIRTQRCDKWAPAANVAMQKALEDAEEIWFSPEHIDRRSSIFDDNIHKFGEIIIKKSNGKLIYMSEKLIKSGFAMYHIGLFHQELSSGNIKSKLEYHQMQDVIKKLKVVNHNDTPNSKKQWEKSVKKQTSLYSVGQNIEALTMKNLERHNSNREIVELLEKKMHDLALCKGVDEISVGRATRKLNNRDELKISSTFSREKLILSNKEEPNSDSAQVLLATKKCLNQHGINMKDSILSSNSREDSDSISENAISDSFQCEDEYDIKNLNKVLDNKFETSPKHLQESIEPNSIEGGNKRPATNKGSHTIHRAPILPLKSQISSHDRKTDMLVAYGPPECNRSKLLIKVIPMNIDRDDDDETDVTRHREGNEIVPEKHMFSEVDTDVNSRITNLETLKDINIGNEDEADLTRHREGNEIVPEKHTFSEVDTDVNIGITNLETLIHKQYSEDNLKEQVKPEQELSQNQLILDNNQHFKVEKPSLPKNRKTSLLLQRKLKLHKEIIQSKLNSSCSSESGTTNKDSNLDEFKTDYCKVKANNSSDDESISDVLKQLDLNNESPIIKIEQTDSQFVHSDTKIYVNPFKNLDGSNSVFVDKLVSPILMVHTNKNNKIQPCSNLRDIPFSTDIHIALKNMTVVKPTRLQSVSWGTILRGHSTFMISPLGSGKTMGYLPAVCHIVADSSIEVSESSGPSCIIVCATALSVSDVENLSKIFLGLKEKVLACYTGMDLLNLTTSLLNGCDLLICTPSILVRLLQTDYGVDLRRLKTFVLDDFERLAEVYCNEIKYALYATKKMVKSRANKELKVQYVVASRKWCDFMKSLVKKAPDSVVCIGAFQECVLYSKTHTSVEFVKKENKINAVIEFLKKNHSSKRTVIACRSDDEVEALENALTNLKYVVFACNHTMTLQDLYNLNISWGNYEEPTMGPILVCCDENLIHLNVTNAHFLLHYSLPPLFSTFCKRFSVLIENYASIYKTENENVKIKVLMDDSNVEQLPKILNFVKRCTDDVPSALDETAEKVLVQKDFAKGKKIVPICGSLLSNGQCPDFWNCQERHTIFEEYDEPNKWVPNDGVITFKILHYHGAVFYSARLLSNVVRGQRKKYSNVYNTLSLKMGTYFSKASNRKLLGIPKVGDVCAVTIKQNFYVRCQVMKIVSRYRNGNPDNVIIKLIDEEKLERSRDFYLFYLPDELKVINTHVVQVRLANVQPKDKDVVFSELAKNHLKKITDQDDDLIMRGQVVLSVGNCVFVETLEACQDLASFGETVVKYNFKQELLNVHATLQPEHISTLKRLCNNANLIPKHDEYIVDIPKPVKVLPEGRWAHLEVDVFSSVYIESVLNMGVFFVRLLKFKDCLASLINEINRSVSEHPETVQQVNLGDIVLAKLPKDIIYKRARIDDIYDNDNVKCFFVDLGQWRDIPTKELVPITDKFITQIPFQAIECRLIGVKPPGEYWSEFSLNWFCFCCFDDRNAKELQVKYFTKDKAEYTGGNKYSVAIIDINAERDVVVNKLMIDLNLAREDEKEIIYLNDLEVENKVPTNDDDDEDSETENASENMPSVPLENIFIKKPIRSVPLVDENNEFDDLDKWDINNESSFMPLFKDVTSDNEALMSEEHEMKSISLKEFQEDAANGTTDNALGIIPTDEKHSNALDTKDLSNSDMTQLPALECSTVVDDLRKPKLCWRQKDDTITIEIKLIGVEKYDLDIKEKELSFSTELDNVKYGFDIELYGVIDKNNSCHSCKGLYILVQLKKVMKRNWLNLTNVDKKWIVYDIDCISTSSDEEDPRDDTPAKIIKSFLEQYESESEEEYYDDSNFKYNK